MVRGRRDQGRIDVYRLRNQQRLAGPPTVAEAIEQPVVENPLVRRMLVDQDQAVRALGDQVSGSRLADRAQHRVGRVPVRLGRCHGGRRLMHCQLRPGNHGAGDRGLVDRAVAERIASIQGRNVNRGPNQ